MNKPQQQLIDCMLDPGFYDHAVDQVKLIETHISLVFLTGKYAYKIKKPVDFGFLDFTRLDRRKFYCEEEIRLNRRLAPDIYLDVIPITKTNETFSIAGDGEIVEYAVRMHEFNQHCLIEQYLNDQKLTDNHILQLADTLANFHNNIAIADEQSPFGLPEEAIKPVEHNFVLLEPILDDDELLKKLNTIKQASLDLYTAIKPVLLQRKQHGFIRECHGDAHLGNIAIIDNEIVIFDGIEFNDSFKWIDTMSELAFLVMDLQDHEQDNYASMVLNRYLETTGDYAGLRVLRFYQLYRAMVRAKVTALRSQQQDKGSKEYQQSMHELHNYFDLALRYIHHSRGFIAITHGISGSGKSWVASRLANASNGILIRSDVERKRLFADKYDNIYTDDITQKTYQHLAQQAELISSAGYPVLVDATFLEKQWRDLFRELAEKHSLPLYILHCHTDTATIEKRIKQRDRNNDDVSDADINIMKQQLDHYQPLADEERAFIIDIDTTEITSLDVVVDRLVDRS